jgi:YrbI family 3-deoxy-D-manno-octulosonate 8-phosphate phosphatase
MDSMVEILALIPARGGSKGVPRKNIKPLGGHPLISYSIAAGLNSSLVNRVIVSTDDTEIADSARFYGADVPFLRPTEIAQDDTQDLPVFQHALDWLNENEGFQPDLVVQLRPTSPFRSLTMVDEAINLLQNNPKATSVRGVVPSKQNPYKMWSIGDDGIMQPLLGSDFSEPFNMPRQELPPTYWQTGHIDVIRRDTILGGSMSGDKVLPYLIDPVFSIDLDNQLDWEQAEGRIKNLRGQITHPSGGKDFPARVSLLVLDFDGVLTDDRVYVNERGEEAVAAFRGDGMGISTLRKRGIETIILSREVNPVVKARGDKLGVPVYQGILEKGEALKKILKEKKIPGDQVVYLGNDVNDLPCFPLVGFAAVVADAHSAVIKEADYVLSKKGGHGAVRELCDLIIESIKD